MKKFFIVLLVFLTAFIFSSCGLSSKDDEHPHYSNEYDSGNSGSTNDNYEKGDYEEDWGNTGNTGDYGNTGDTGNTGDYIPGEEEQSPDPDNVGELIENEFVKTSEEHTSTFSIDVDTASYSLIRNYILNYYQLPPVSSVRIEEMVNYFDYDYPQPEEDKPFSVTMEMSPSPWRDDSHLIMFGLKGKEIDEENRPPSNLVFLIDTSGSMSPANRLPLLKKAFKILVGRLTEKDIVSIVTYASQTGVVLDSVPGDQKNKINDAIDSLVASGATAGYNGIEKAYKLAEKNHHSEYNSRVILATDGDFNVGPYSNAELVSLIEKERNKGIFLTILGFGMGNYQDNKMEELSNAGNGNYFYIDNEKEAEKVFVHDLMGNMFTIAKDVKLQVVFNPEKIYMYRLIGYENRVLANEDFDDDTKDAGEIGSGHRVTAFYEVILTSEENEEEPETVNDEDEEINDEDIDEDIEDIIEEDFDANEFLVLKMRYKEPDEDISKYMDTVMTEDHFNEEMSENMGFASSVVEFGMLLRKSKFKENSSYDSVEERAKNSIGTDIFGYRGEFLEIVDKAKTLDK